MKTTNNIPENIVNQLSASGMSYDEMLEKMKTAIEVVKQQQKLDQIAQRKEQQEPVVFETEVDGFKPDPDVPFWEQNLNPITMWPYPHKIKITEDNTEYYIEKETKTKLTA